ncbi:hypothetical protein PENTCL1PPCAC_7995, partial [Pristionchus entomophagus]
VVDVDLGVEASHFVIGAGQPEDAVRSRLTLIKLIVVKRVLVEQLDLDMARGFVVAHQLATDGDGLRGADQASGSEGEKIREGEKAKHCEKMNRR